jgi:hypothetical protein
LTGGNPIFGQQNPGARYHSFIGSDDWSILHTRYLESLAGLISLARDVGWGKPLPYSMEPQERFINYVEKIDWGESPTKVLGKLHKEKSHVQAMSSNFRSQPMMQQQTQFTFAWSRPWFLPKTWPTVQVFLATKC